MIAAVASLALLSAAAPKMSAWLVFDDDGASLADFQAHADQLDTVSADWILCDDNGNAVRRPTPNAAQKATLHRIAKAHHVRLLGMAGNSGDHGFGPIGVEKFLATEDLMFAHAKGLVKIVVEEGLDLDYESLLAKDRDAFSRFVDILAKQCHEHRLTLAIALHPKESEPGNWDGAQAQDYARIGKAVDLARVMTYDEHWETSEAGPVASPAWTERVAAFSVSAIPPGKLDLGLPGYGYDWVGKKGSDFGWRQYNDLVKAHVGASRDPGSGEMTLKYADHTVFYPDATSAATKVEIAKKTGVRGLALWRLGLEDPGMWDLIPKRTR